MFDGLSEIRPPLARVRSPLSADDLRRLDVLKLALAGIERRWCKGAYQSKGASDDDRFRCPVRWLEQYSSPTRARTIIKKHLYPLIPSFYAVYNRPRDALMAYNDDNTTKLADMISLFRRAIQRLEWGV